MKTNAIVRIILFSLAIIILSGIFLGVLVFDMFRFDSNVQIEQGDKVETLEQIDIEYFTPDIRNIEIDWVAGNIIFQKEPYATEITVHEISPVGCEYVMVCKQSGQTLKIQYSEDSTFQFPSFGVDIDISKDLVISVPADWECGSLEIDTAAAEVVINDLTIGEFDFDGASGVCEIINCNVRELNIDTASGDVHFSGILETLDCDAASADCTIEVTNIPRSIKLDGMSGDLELILPPDAGFICELDTMSGTFDSDFKFQTHNDTYVCGDGACKIKVSAMSGAVSILKGIE